VFCQHFAEPPFGLQPNFGAAVLRRKPKPGPASEVPHRIGDVGKPDEISRRPRLGDCPESVIDIDDFFHRSPTQIGKSASVRNPVAVRRVYKESSTRV
jgi:hypothetical protein